MTESKLWRAESAGRLRAAMADGSHPARAAFGHWYRVRVWNSIATRVIARPLAFESAGAIEACFADLEGRWLARHARLCEAAGLDPSLHDVLAASAIGRVFACARDRMGMGMAGAGAGVTDGDLGVLG